MIKCVVWDLDDTLWQGTLAEDGQVYLPEENRALLAELDAAGILQSLASRNDPAAAMERLRSLGVQHYFLYPQLGYHSKALSIQTIERKLNIGLDTVAFLDDSEFELQEVGYFLPQVHLYRAWDDRRRLTEAVRSRGAVTEESRNRRSMMQAQEKWNQEEETFAGSREEFLKACAMRLTVREAQEGDLQRVCELVERSSQYKTFQQAMDPEQCRRYQADGRSKVWVAELGDRFGWYGIIGVCFLRAENREVLIDQFCISCRVGGRGVGVLFLQAVLDQCTDCTRAICRYTATSRNRPVSVLLKTLGFRRIADSGGANGLEAALPLAHAECDWMTIQLDRG